MVADPVRPLVYGLHQNGANAGSVIVYNLVTRSVTRGITVGNFPSDLAIRPDGSALYVLNTGSKSISRINLDSLTVEKTTGLAEFGTWGSDITVTPGNLGLGPGNVVYYTDGAWAPALHAIDFETGLHIQQTQFAGPSDTNGFGDFVVSPDGTKLFGWKQYGWTAGVLGTFVARYGVSGSGSLTFEVSGTNERLGAWDRDPLDTPALMDSSGEILLIKNRVVDPDDPLVFPRSFPVPVYSLSSGGQVAGAVGALYHGPTTEALATLPDLGKVQCFSQDGSFLVHFKSSTASIEVVDLVALLGMDVLELDVSPAPFSVGSSPNVFEWFPRVGATSYRVYLGNSESAVDAAGPGSNLVIGETANPSLPNPSVLSPGTYFWRVDAITPHGIMKGDVVSFSVSLISLPKGKLDFGAVVGVTKATVTLPLAKSGSEEVAWAVNSDRPWLVPTVSSGTTPSQLRVEANLAGLSVGLHEGSVTIETNGTAFEVPASIRVVALNYTHLEADVQLPYVYGISQVSESSTSPAYLLRIDAATGAVSDAVPVGSSVSDVEIHYAENRIYVTNWMTGKLRALDRTTLGEVQVYPFTPFGGAGVGGDVYRISAGKAGRLIVEEKDQWIDVSLMNTATGAILDTAFEREGGGMYDPTGRYYYHGDNNISNASLHRFDTDGDQITELSAVRTTGVSYYGSRTVKRSGDGTRYYWNGTAHDAQLNVLWTINEEIQAASLHGDVVFTPGEIRNGATGAVMSALPVSTPVMAIGGDQENLFLASGANLTVVDLSTLIELPGQGIEPAIVDGSVVIGVEQTLGWSLDPFATGYKVYFGTSRAAVEAADETSGEYLGMVTGGELALPSDLVLGGQYFWRVDAVGFVGTSSGPVWSFEVAPLEISPSRLSISIPSGLRTTRTLELSASSPVSWTALVAPGGPLSLDATNGTTPGNVTVAVDAQGLEVGSHSASITFDAGGKIFAVPVEIEVLSLNYTHLESDAQLPYVYGITQVSESSTSPAYLLRIDASTGAVLDAVPVGSSVSDVEIHYAENRIYVTNWMTGKLRALDRTTLEEVQVYSFTPFGGAGVGGDVYRISAGKAGRLIVEENDQWIDVSLMNTASGVILRTTSAREGGGANDPTGRYYYHGDNNISNASLRRFDTNGDNLNLLSSIRTSGYSYFGDRTVVMTRDGSRVFWNGTAHDHLLNVLWTGTRRIVAATANGRVVFVPGKALNGRTGEELVDLPVSTPLMAVGSDQETLILASGSSLTVVGLGTLILPPAEEIAPVIPDGSTVVGGDQTLNWTDAPRADTYKVYLGQSRAEVETADESSSGYLGEIESNSLELLGLIEPGQSYFWRVDAVGVLETTKGDVWSFGVDHVSLQPDVMVGLAPSAGLGDDLYSTEGDNQIVSKKLKGRRTGTIYFWVENDGNFGDSFSLISTRGSRNLDLTYMLGSPFSANVTATITLPTGMPLAEQGPGSTTGLKAVVRKSKKSKSRRSSLTLLFRAVSEGDGSVDAARGLIKQAD